MPAPRRTVPTEAPDSPRPLLVGGAWLGEERNGLNRYLADLVAALESAHLRPVAVVTGPPRGCPPPFRPAARGDDPLWRRLIGIHRAVGGMAGGTDVIDAHFALYALLPALVGRARRLPLVVHFHGPWAEESAAARGEGRATVATKQLVERTVYRRAQNVVVLSDAFSRLVQERYGVAPWAVEVIPPAVDLSLFRPGSRLEARARLGLPADAWVAVSVRRMVPRTGLGNLLRAWAGMAHDGEDLLLLAGDGPQRSQLAGLAHELGVTRSVRFLGEVDDSELVSCYQAADVCVVPSVAMEGFGLVALEALACATPVVATDVDGLPDATRGLDSTLVVPAADAAALARRLAQGRDGIVSFPDGDACRRHAERFSFEGLADRHIDLYGQAAGVRPAPMRVAYVLHTAALSGAGIALLRLLPALTDVRAHVILGEDGPLVSRLLDMGVPVDVLPMDEGARTMHRDRVGATAALTAVAWPVARHTARLAARFRALRPDLVHTFTLKANFYGGVAGRLAGVPVVWHGHDRIAPDYLPPAAVRLVRAAAPRLPRLVVANSQATLETMEPLGERGCVIPYPLDPSAVLPPRPRDDRPVAVGVVGRVGPWKGQHLFVEAFARAFPPGSSVEGVVVGGPLFGGEEEDYDRRLRRLARDLGVAERIRFTGFVEDVWPELAALDVLVHTSVIPEPFGQVIVEGMAAGLAVVAADTGGPGEIVDDGVNGLLYPMGDAEALAQTMARVATDADLRERLGQGGRSRAGDFAPERVAAQVSDAYRRALSRSGPGSPLSLAALRR